MLYDPSFEAPTNSNVRLAATILTDLGFERSIPWQQSINGTVALSRYRRGQTVVTLILRRREFSIAFGLSGHHAAPVPVPGDAHEVAQALKAAGVVATFTNLEDADHE